jgi:hypothetical protein
MNNLIIGHVIHEIIHVVVTSLWTSVTTLVLGGWTWLLTQRPEAIPPEAWRRKPTIQALEALADQIFWAWGWLLAISLVFSLLWIYLVKIYRPTSPLQAVKFRRYWLTIAALLLCSTVVFYGFALNFCPQFQELTSFSLLVLLAAFVFCAFAFLYMLSVLRSPPTVIAAVPFGSYVGHLRWR